MFRPLKRRAAVTAIIAAAALTSVGCGVQVSDTGAGTGVATEPNLIEPQDSNQKVEQPTDFEGTGGVVKLRDAADATGQVNSLTMSMTVDLSMMGESTTMSMDGAVDNTNKKMSMTMSMDVLGSSMDLGYIVDGTTMYMKGMPGMGMAASTPWVSTDMSEMGDAWSQQASSNQALDFLTYLDNVSDTDVVDLGTEDIDGVSTQHYKADVDLQAVLDNAGEGAADQYAESLIEAGVELPLIPMEVWVDDDGMVRQMTMDFSAEVDGETVSMLMTANFSGFNEPVDITIPDPSEVTAVDASMFEN